MNYLSQQLELSNGAGRTPSKAARVAWILIAAILFAALQPGSAHAQESDILLPEKECQVKYALLYSFGLLTTWPKEAVNPPDTGQFVIGVLGAKPFPEYLARIAASKKIQRRVIVIKHFKAVEEVGLCHILYVTSAVTPEVERTVARKLANHPVLLVSERAKESGGNGVIEFVIDQGAVKFYLDADAAKARHLQLDPRLVKLAKVRPAPLETTVSSP